MFRAFADTTRLRILCLLRRGELCVCELMAAMLEPQSKISRHLAYLRGAGLVVGRREGKWRRYRIAGAEGRFQTSLIGCLGGCLREVPLLHRDLARLRGLKRRNCG